MQFYAHSGKNSDKSDWQSLEGHLQGVAKLAKEFAAVFGAGTWGEYSGLLHDAGKATKVFTRRLEGKPVRVNHSGFGAQSATEQAGKFGILIAYAVAGHHGGLADGGLQEGQLHYRLKHDKIEPDTVSLPEISSISVLELPFKLDRKTAGFSLSFFTRMIFSCLTDADFLDTEAFCSPDLAEVRYSKRTPVTFLALAAQLHNFIEKKQMHADDSPVNRIRSNVLAQCRHCAQNTPGFFSLTVPTGGGKTLSSLSFALDHAHKNNLRRVIYAIPFTSIIEQNAQVFEEALGQENVLEHHCNYKEKDDPEERTYERRRGLTTENWDAPVIVTTNVQFFESLFSNKSSRCRKLHNIADSVIVLDEAQAIPTEYLEPCLAALRELVTHYGCSVMLCTATQPALDDQSQLRMALPDIREIVAAPHVLYQALERTRVEMVGRLSQDQLAEQLRTEKQVLCIVSTKAQARELFEELQQDNGCFHLSTNMYPEHRRQVFNTIRSHLKQGESCRVISTSLVEAGVDLDFPVVYRAMAGLDSIAQAAGRCNREGLLKFGRVVVFEHEKSPSMPWLKRCMSKAAETLRTLPRANPLGLEAMRRYFELLYDVEELDKKQIFARLNQLTPQLYFDFRTIADEFCFIEDDSVGVIIPRESEAARLVKALRYAEHPRNILRRLQQYSVSVRMKDFQTLKGSGAVEMVHERIPVLCNLDAYKNDVGLCVEDGSVWDPEHLIP